MNNLGRASESQNPSFKENFDNLTSGIQQIIDIGAESLAEAQRKTELASKISAESEEYVNLIKDIKAAQARSGSAFQKAEILIKAANSILSDSSQ